MEVDRNDHSMMFHFIHFSFLRTLAAQSALLQFVFEIRNWTDYIWTFSLSVTQLFSTLHHRPKRGVSFPWSRDIKVMETRLYHIFHAHFDSTPWHFAHRHKKNKNVPCFFFLPGFRAAVGCPNSTPNIPNCFLKCIYFFNLAVDNTPDCAGTSVRFGMCGSNSEYWLNLDLLFVWGLVY